MPAVQRRGWRFTLNNYNDDEVATIRTILSRRTRGGVGALYAVFGYENAPSTGTPHLQGYVYFEKKITGSAARHVIGTPRIAVLQADAKPQDNKTYCTKDGNFEEFGTCPSGQGHRRDTERVAELVLSGKRLRDIACEEPAAFIKHSRGIAALRDATRARERVVPVLKVFWGGGGVGKSCYMLSLCREQEERGRNVYQWNGEGKWWDQYDQEEVVCLDDFTGADLSIRVWNKLFNVIPFQVEKKGSSVWFTSDTVYITSNYPPRLWWPNVEPARRFTALRRITTVTYFNDPSYTGGNVHATKAFGPVQLVEHAPQEIPPHALEYLETLQPSPPIHITADAF